MDSPNGGGHLHEIIMITMHACAYMCMHVHMYVGHPQQPPTPSTHPHPPTPHPPESQGA